MRSWGARSFSRWVTAPPEWDPEAPRALSQGAVTAVLWMSSFFSRGEALLEGGPAVHLAKPPPPHPNRRFSGRRYLVMKTAGVHIPVYSRLVQRLFRYRVFLFCFIFVCFFVGKLQHKMNKRQMSARAFCDITWVKWIQGPVTILSNLSITCVHKLLSMTCLNKTYPENIIKQKAKARRSKLINYKWRLIELQRPKLIFNF